jgi:hypothetical protein
VKRKRNEELRAMLRESSNRRRKSRPSLDQAKGAAGVHGARIGDETQLQAEPRLFVEDVGAHGQGVQAREHTRRIYNCFRASAPSLMSSSRMSRR